MKVGPLIDIGMQSLNQFTVGGSNDVKAGSFIYPQLLIEISILPTLRNHEMTPLVTAMVRRKITGPPIL